MPVPGGVNTAAAKHSKVAVDSSAYGGSVHMNNGSDGIRNAP